MLGTKKPATAPTRSSRSQRTPTDSKRINEGLRKIQPTPVCTNERESHQSGQCTITGFQHTIPLHSRVQYHRIPACNTTAFQRAISPHSSVQYHRIPACNTTVPSSERATIERASERASKHEACRGQYERASEARGVKGHIERASERIWPSRVKSYGGEAAIARRDSDAQNPRTTDRTPWDTTH